MKRAYLIWGGIIGVVVLFVAVDALNPRGRQAQYLRVRARHILIRLGSKSPEDTIKARERIEEVYERIKEGENFAALAQEYSEDPGSGSKGGDLGILTQGIDELDADFAEVVFNLKAGEISPIVRTQFGFHIIKCEKRMEPKRKVADSTD